MKKKEDTAHLTYVLSNKQIFCKLPSKSFGLEPDSVTKKLPHFNPKCNYGTIYL